MVSDSTVPGQMVKQIYNIKCILILGLSVLKEQSEIIEQFYVNNMLCWKFIRYHMNVAHIRILLTD